MLLYLLMLVLSISGCADGAARSMPVGKFMGVVLLATVLLLAPNSVLSTFGDIAGVVSSLFLVAQAILLMDFAYTWNSTWVTNAENARRRNFLGREPCLWYSGLVGFSVLFLLGATGGTVYLCIAFPEAGARVLSISALVISSALLFVSLLDAVKGTLLTATVSAAYTTWVAFEALTVKPAGLDDIAGGQGVPVWAALSIAVLSLIASTTSADGSAPDVAAPNGVEMQRISDEGVEAGQAREVLVKDARIGQASSGDFATQCAVHAAAALYVTSTLAPSIGWVSFVSRVLALYASLFLYGWSLIAPLVLTNRVFD